MTDSEDWLGKSMDLSGSDSLDGSDEIKVVSWNSQGFSKEKYEKLDEMMDDQNMDVAFLQEAPNPESMKMIVDSGKYFVHAEQEQPTPAQRHLPGYEDNIYPTVSVSRFNAVLVKKRKGLKFQPDTWIPGNSKHVQAYMLQENSGLDNPSEYTDEVLRNCGVMSGERDEVIDDEPDERQRQILKPATTVGKPRRSKRVKKKPFNEERVKCLGNRWPMRIKIKKGNNEPIEFLSWHAPEGGNKKDALPACKLMMLSMGNKFSRRTVLLGDFNVGEKDAKDVFKGADVNGADYEDWSYVASSKGLKAEPMELGDPDNFKSQNGGDGKSDHGPLMCKFGSK